MYDDQPFVGISLISNMMGYEHIIMNQMKQRYLLFSHLVFSQVWLSVAVQIYQGGTSPQSRNTAEDLSNERVNTTV